MACAKSVRASDALTPSLSTTVTGQSVACSHLCCVSVQVGMFKIHPEVPDSMSGEAKAFILSCFEAEPDKRATATALLQEPFLKTPSRRKTRSPIATGEVGREATSEKSTSAEGVAERRTPLPSFQSLRTQTEGSLRAPSPSSGEKTQRSSYLR